MAKLPACPPARAGVPWSREPVKLGVTHVREELAALWAQERMVVAAVLAAGAFVAPAAQAAIVHSTPAPDLPDERPRERDRHPERRHLHRRALHRRTTRRLLLRKRDPKPRRSLEPGDRPGAAVGPERERHRAGARRRAGARSTWAARSRPSAEPPALRLAAVDAGDRRRRFRLRTARPDGTVNSLALSGTTLYAGGSFTERQRHAAGQPGGVRRHERRPQHDVGSRPPTPS